MRHLCLWLSSHPDTGKGLLTSILGFSGKESSWSAFSFVRISFNLSNTLAKSVVGPCLLTGLPGLWIEGHLDQQFGINSLQVNGPINDDVANLIVAQLLFLESENPEKLVSSIEPTISIPCLHIYTHSYLTDFWPSIFECMPDYRLARVQSSYDDHHTSVLNAEADQLILDTCFDADQHVH